MSARHTPGPWTLDACEGGWMLLAEGRDITTEPFDADDADAALITAAPDLLAALDRAEAFIAGFEDDDTQEGVTEMLAAIRAALANAKGE